MRTVRKNLSALLIKGAVCLFSLALVEAVAVLVAEFLRSCINIFMQLSSVI